MFQVTGSCVFISVNRARRYLADRKWCRHVLGLAWQCCEDGGVQSRSAAAAVVVRMPLQFRLRPRLEGCQRPGRASQPGRPQTRWSAGEGCTCSRSRWGLTASKGDRLEAVGGGGLPGGPDPPLSQAHLDQQPGSAGVSAGPQRGRRPLHGKLFGFRWGDGHLLGVSPQWV